MITQLKQLLAGEDGQDMVEYSLLLAFVALAAVALLSGIRTSVRGIYTSVNSALSSAQAGSS